MAAQDTAAAMLPVPGKVPAVLPAPSTAAATPVVVEAAESGLTQTETATAAAEAATAETVETPAAEAVVSGDDNVSVGSDGHRRRWQQRRRQ